MKEIAQEFIKRNTKLVRNLLVMIIGILLLWGVFNGNDLVTKFINKPTEGQSATNYNGRNQNINTGSNNGVIGNNNVITVETEKNWRKLNIYGKQQLRSAIDSIIKTDFHNNRNCKVKVASITDAEALNFAQVMQSFVKEEGYNISKRINTYEQSPVINGVRINSKFRDAVYIWVGINPSKK